MSIQNNTVFSFFDVQRTLEEEKYWRKELAGDLPDTNLPVSDVRPAQVDTQTLKFVIPENVVTQLIRLCKNSELSLYLIFLTALKSVLYRYNGQMESLIGSPIYQPTITEETNNNVVLIRSQVKDDLSFKALLLQVKEKTLKAYEHQNYPFSTLLKTLNLVKDKERLPRVLCLLQNIHDSNSLRGVARDVTVVFNYQNTKIDGQLTYLSSLFETETIQRFSEHLVNVLTSAITNINIPISRLQLLSRAEEQQLLIAFNQSKAEYHKDKTLVELFEAQVHNTPEAIAVIFENQQLTYQELNTKANQLAHYLQTLGVKPEVLVGICVERSVEMAIGLLGVLKASGAYLPLDPTLPSARLVFMVKNAAVTVLLTQSNLIEKLSETNAKMVCLKTEAETLSQYDANNPVHVIGPSNLAYVIYTSGSTGAPKGVMIEHQGMLNHLYAKIDDLQLTATDIVAQNAPLTFDISVWQFFAVWLKGGQICIFNEEAAKHPVQLLKTVVQQRITILEIVPSLLRALLEIIRAETPPNFSQLRWLVLTGEALPPQLCTQWLESYPTIPMLNAYGPTECSDDVSHYQIDQSPGPEVTQLPIGQPINNTQLYVLDKRLQPLPIRIAGELYVGGIGVGRGYLNAPDKTAEVFVANPFNKDNTRLYKTGDLARFLQDGKVEYLGRIDNQVKIRGFRIELGEIEAVLGQHPALKENAVIVHEASKKTDQPVPTQEHGNEKRLVAYIVFHSEQVVENTALRRFLGERLPDYMVPSIFVPLEKLPLTTNGKIDKKALPDPSGTRTGLETDYIAPRDELEKQLVAIWEIILATQPIGIEDNFFELGGHSIKATQLATKIHKALKMEINLRDIFNSPTIAGLAALLQKKDSSEVSRIEPIPVAKHYPLSYAQRRLWLMDKLEENSLTYNIHDTIQLEGYLNVLALKQAFQTLVNRHESLRTVFISVEGQPRQQILEQVAFQVTEVDLSKQSHQGISVQYLMDKEATTPFDLSTGPLFRAVLLKAANNQYFIILTIHHIISDGWSLGVLSQELFSLYKAYSAGKENPLPPLRVQYKDYAAWQTQQLIGATQLQRYWYDKLSAPLPMLNLSTDYPRPAVKTYDSDTITFTLESTVMEGLNKISKAQQASLFMIFVALVRTLLYRYTAQQDIIIGTALAGRNHPDLQDQIGFYVNMLPLRTQINGDDSFQAILQQERKLILEADEHQAYPFDLLVAELNLDQDRSRFPLFDVLVDFQEDNFIESDSFGNDVKTSLFGYEPQVSEYDLAFFFRETQGQFHLNITYSTHLFKRDTITRLWEHFEKIVNAVLDNPGSPISAISLGEKVMPEEEIEIATQFGF